MDYETYQEKFLKNSTKNVTVKFRRARQIHTHDKTSICPECGTKTTIDMDRGEIYCDGCGLVVKASIPYVGVRKVSYPYGILL